MNKEYFDELSGRIEGLANFVLSLTAQLEMNGHIDGPEFTGAIHRYAAGRTIPGQPECTAAARVMLAGLANELRQNRDRVRQ
jgi:hypothetical protein